MDNDTLVDLKQFIEATVSQQLALQTEDLRESIHADVKKDVDRLDDKLTKRIDKLDQKIDDLSAAVGDAIETSNEESHKQLKDHERRITRLEKRAA